MVWFPTFMVVGLILCMLGNLHAFCCLLIIVKINFFAKAFSGIPLSCQTVRIEVWHIFYRA